LPVNNLIEFVAIVAVATIKIEIEMAGSACLVLLKQLFSQV
jgi:hypothetical protein